MAAGGSFTHSLRPPALVARLHPPGVMRNNCVGAVEPGGRPARHGLGGWQGLMLIKVRPGSRIGLAASYVLAPVFSISILGSRTGVAIRNKYSLVHYGRRTAPAHRLFESVRTCGGGHEASGGRSGRMEMAMRHRLTAIIEREGDGYVGPRPELDIASQGNSVEAAGEPARGPGIVLRVGFSRRGRTAAHERGVRHAHRGRCWVGYGCCPVKRSVSSLSVMGSWRFAVAVATSSCNGHGADDNVPCRITRNCDRERFGRLSGNQGSHAVISRRVEVMPDPAPSWSTVGRGC